MLCIRLPHAIEQRLAYLAKETSRTKTFYAKKAIIEQIEDLEDFYLAKERLKNPGRLYTLDEVDEMINVDLKIHRKSGKRAT